MEQRILTLLEPDVPTDNVWNAGSTSQNTHSPSITEADCLTLLKATADQDRTSITNELRSQSVQLFTLKQW